MVRESSQGAKAALFERERELVQVDELIAASAEGDGRFLVIEGRAGLGKTSLLAEVGARAAEQGMSVLRARGTDLESGFAFGVVRQLFEPVVRRSEKDLFKGAAALAAPVLGSAQEPAADGQLSVLHGLYWLAADLADTLPLLLAVDDAHWADQPSLRWLLYFMNRLEGLPVLVAVTTRPLRPGSPGELATLLSAAGAHQLHLEALGRESVAAWIERDFGTVPAPEFTDACKRATAGSPLALRALIRDLVQTGIQPIATEAASVEHRAPVAIARWTLASLSRVGAPTRDFARALAVVGDGADLRLVAAVAGLDPMAASRAADDLSAADLILPSRPPSFIHPLIRAAVDGNLTLTDRSELHLRTADLLVAEGADPEVVAAHLLRSEPGTSGETVERLRAAAPLAIRRGAPEVAIAYLRRALAEGPGGEEQTSLLAELGRAELLTNDPAAAGHLRHALDGCQDPVRRAAIRKDLAQTFLLSGDPHLYVELLREALDELGDRDPETSAHTEVLIAIRAATYVHESARMADPIPRLSVIAHGQGRAARTARLGLASLLARRGERLEDVAANVEWSLEGEAARPVEPPDPSIAFFAGYALVLVDELDRARRLANLIIADAASRGSVLDFVRGSTVRAFADLRTGLLAEAQTDAQAARERAEQHDLVTWATFASSYQAEILLELGQLDAAEGLIESARIKPGRVEAVPEAWIRRSRGVVRCASGRAEDGIADLRAAGEFLELMSSTETPLIGVSSGLQWRSPLALALVHSSPDEARRLAKTDLREARVLGLPRRVGIALRTTAALSADGVAVDLLREAVQVLESSPAVLELARAQLDLGAALRRVGHRVEAREPLRQALEIATRCGAVPIAERARAEALLAGARPRRPRLSGLFALTPSELRVARLAAEGHTNREIAQALFITTKTVKDHLNSAYGKLEIGSRTDLAAALAGAES